ncbi:MAG: FAD-dependent oxidoreductase [Polyangiales bacterium]
MQLRQEDAGTTAYNLVGFQTRMTWGEQGRVLRMIPGLENAEFMRFGSVHRNTFVNAPEVLAATLELRAAPGIYLAGQVTGVEGYLESAACGLLCAINVARALRGEAHAPPPETTALGGLLTHLRGNGSAFQPSNITWAHVPPLVETGRKKIPKRERYERLAARALDDIAPWVARVREGVDFARVEAIVPQGVVTTSSAVCEGDAVTGPAPGTTAPSAR